jgi:hypothetical protein
VGTFRSAYSDQEQEGVPKIHADLKALRSKIGGLKAEKKTGVSFQIKSAKDLMIKLRPALDELDMNCYPVAMTGQSVPVDKGTMADVTCVYRFVSSDGSYVDMAGFGQGVDSQDKAGGKAITYAWKALNIYGNSLPDKDMVDADDDEKPTKEAAISRITPETARAALGALTEPGQFAAWKAKYLATLPAAVKAEIGEEAKAKYASLKAAETPAEVAA